LIFIYLFFLFKFTTMATYPPETTSTEVSPAKPKQNPAVASFVVNVPPSCDAPGNLCKFHTEKVTSGKLLAILGCGIAEPILAAILNQLSPQEPDLDDPYNILPKRVCAINACVMCDAENASKCIASTPVFVSVPQYDCANASPCASRKRKSMTVED
jgi:hypothetical protein